jgi:FkbM family methyltransferase
MNPAPANSTKRFEATVKGHPVRLNVRPQTDDLDIFQDVLNNQSYRDACLLLDGNSVVIDVGGHIGSFSVCSALRGAHVLTLEPVPGNYELLVQNVHLNDMQGQVKPLNVAMWSSSCEKTIRVADDSTGGSGFYYNKDTAPSLLTSCVRLDELMDAEGISSCDLLKLDCEGAEFEILQTLSQETWARIKAIILEYHLFTGYSLTALQELLVNHGFLIATRPSVDEKLGFILAVRDIQVTIPRLPALHRTSFESPGTRLPVIGALWRLIRRPAHNLVLFYLNQLIASYNESQEQADVYLRVLSQHAQYVRSDRGPAAPAPEEDAVERVAPPVTGGGVVE